MTKEKAGEIIAFKMMNNVREMEQIKNKPKHELKDLVKAVELHGFNDGAEWAIELLSKIER